MAIYGTSGGVPLLDFSSIGDLGKTYKDASNERLLADLGKRLTTGDIDYKQAAGMAAEAGRLDLGLNLLKMGEEKEAGETFQKMIGGNGGAPPQPQPEPRPTMSPGVTSGPRPAGAPPLTTAPMVQPPNVAPAMMPSYNGEPPRPKVASTPTVIGDDEAIANGLYEDAPGTKVPLPPQRPAAAGPSAVPTAPMEPPAPPAPRAAPMAPQQQPSRPGAPVPSENPVAGNIPGLIAAIAHPRLPAAQKELAKTLLTKALEDSKLTDQQKAYVWYRAQGGQGTMQDMILEQRRAGAPEGGETAFEKAMGTGQAKRWNGYIEEADKAQNKLVDINSMRDISRRVGSQGAWAGVKEFVGPYAEALGIDLKNLSDIQAFSSTIQRLAPQNRVAGSGSTSDIEFKGMVKAMPTLVNNPAAREVILDTMEAFARDDVARGDIASRLAAKEIGRIQAEKELRALGDPMARFREWRKANQQVFGEALRAGDATAAPASGGNLPSYKTPADVGAALRAGTLRKGDKFIAGDGQTRTVP